jgi:MFS family permease
MFLDKIFFINAMAFISINSVIPYFLDNLGASTFEISLASVLAALGTLITQPIFAKLAMKLPYKLKTLVKILFLQRVLFLIFVISIPFVASKSPILMIVLFLLCWGMFNLFVGCYGPFYMSIMPKLISNEQRGRLLGFGNAFGSIIAIGSSVLIGVLLDKVVYPYNYTIIFTIGVIILFVDVFVFHFMVNEAPDEVAKSDLGYFQYFKYIPKVLKGNKKFFQVVIGNSFFTVATMVLAYYTLYAIRNYNIGAAEIAIFNGIAMLVNIFGNILLGIIADKLGHRLSLQYSAFFGLSAGVVVLAINSITAVYIAFALTSLCACGYQLSSWIFIIEHSPKEELPIYISINSMITLIISSIVLTISGIVIDRFSFQPVFVLTLITGLGAYYIYKKLK